MIHMTLIPFYWVGPGGAGSSTTTRGGANLSAESLDTLETEAKQAGAASNPLLEQDGSRKNK